MRGDRSSHLYQGDFERYILVVNPTEGNYAGITEMHLRMRPLTYATLRDDLSLLGDEIFIHWVWTKQR